MNLLRNARLHIHACAHAQLHGAGSCTRICVGHMRCADCRSECTGFPDPKDPAYCVEPRLEQVLEIGFFSSPATASYESSQRGLQMYTHPQI